MPNEFRVISWGPIIMETNQGICPTPLTSKVVDVCFSKCNTYVEYWFWSQVSKQMGLLSPNNIQNPETF